MTEKNMWATWFTHGGQPLETPEPFPLESQSITDSVNEIMIRFDSANVIFQNVAIAIIALAAIDSGNEKLERRLIIADQQFGQQGTSQ
ncbi:hypothetical protein [Plesiomonas sp.]|uniref:hypothetical protein n=1 Tax=Plesiomonas sp. TaxID=2486279 RepID=UPI003F3EE8BA